MPMTFPAGVDAFGDPATGSVVPWERNHAEEQGVAQVRSLAYVQPTIGRWRPVKGLFQQSSREDVLIKLAGLALSEAQHRMFLRFLALSVKQTIYFSHFAGDVFVCQLTDYQPQEIQPPRGYVRAWSYTCQIDTINA